MALELTGKIIFISEEVQQGTSKAGKSWKKQLFAIETNDQYPKKVAMSVMGDEVDELSNYKVGYEVTCGINIESRQYNSKWYTDVNCWKLAGSSSNAQTNEPDPFHPDDIMDDVPF